MNRQLPLWVFLLCLLVGVLFVMTFGWAVRTTMLGSDRTGVFGRAAVSVAEFPSTTKQVVKELLGYASGDYADAEVSVPREKAPDAQGFTPLPVAIEAEIPGLAFRATETAQPGWRFVSGTFEIDGAVTHAALLISPGLEVVHHWILDEPPIEGVEIRPRHRIFPHGIALLPDGSLIVAFDGGMTLQRLGACGDRDWVLQAEFHHALTLDPGGETVWGLNSDAKGWGDSLAEVSLTDGRIVRQVSMDDIITANPDLDILGVRRVDRLKDHGPTSNTRNTPGVWLTDPFHINDVDPLPAAIAAAFPLFETGDLLVSARTPNMVMVVDPDTAEVKWWRMGMVRRQHDPDWMPTGEFLVYDNRTGQDASRIVAIDPADFSLRVELDGRQTGFFSRIRGKQQRRPDGTLVVTSSQQGHAFETGPDGGVNFELVNAKPGSSDKNYAVSEMQWFPLTGLIRLAGPAQDDDPERRMT